ncbi:MAG TPA: hypothetical protein VNT79_05960, partial [Phycisphaerae bacterium]|nr:hypothetical protein [Phycisphaerae bacterium]
MPSASILLPASSDERRFPALLANPNFILLWLAYGISALGDHLSEMGLLKLQNALEKDVTDIVRRQAAMTFWF